MCALQDINMKPIIVQMYITKDDFPSFVKTSYKSMEESGNRVVFYSNKHPDFVSDKNFKSILIDQNLSRFDIIYGEKFKCIRDCLLNIGPCIWADSDCFINRNDMSFPLTKNFAICDYSDRSKNYKKKLQQGIMIVGYEGLFVIDELIEQYYKTKEDGEIINMNLYKNYFNKIEILDSSYNFPCHRMRRKECPSSIYPYVLHFHPNKTKHLKFAEPYMTKQTKKLFNISI